MFKFFSRYKSIGAIETSFLIYVLGAVLSFGSQMLLARIMGVFEYGIYFYALSWIMLLVMIVQFGIDQTLLKFMPVYIHNEDWSRGSGILNVANRFVLLNGIFVASLLITVVFFLGDNLSLAQHNVFLITAFCLPIKSLIYIRQATLRSFMFTARSLLPDAVIAPFVLMIIAIGLSLFGKPSSLMMMVATLVALTFSFVLGAYWQQNLVPQELKKAKPKYEINEWAKLAIMMFIINGAHSLLNSVDVLILGLYQPADIVGVYGVAGRLSTIVTFVLISTYPVFAPLITKYLSAGEGGKLQKEIVRVMRPIAIISITLGLLMMLNSKTILGYYGEAFTSGNRVLCVLVIGQMINAFCGPVALLLAYGSHQKEVARVLAIASIMNVGLNFALVPTFGMMGAATATALATIFWNFTLYILTRRYLGLDSSGWFSKSII